MPVIETSIVGRCVLTREKINIADLYELDEPARQQPVGLPHDRSFDDKIGYRTRSMLAVPMISARDEVIGVIQLINKKREAARQAATRRATSTSGSCRSTTRSPSYSSALAAQAGIALENALLYEEIRDSSRASCAPACRRSSSATRPPRSLASASRADRRARRDGRPRRDAAATASARVLPATSCASSSTRRCSTTSARSACASRCWSRPRSSTRTSAS